MPQRLQLWFDVESRYMTTDLMMTMTKERLWFDVESRYMTTDVVSYCIGRWLWFDVESRYMTTCEQANATSSAVVV